MNGTDVLHRTRAALATNPEQWAPAMHDWIHGILEPTGLRQTTATEDEVREAIAWGAAYLAATT